MTAWNTIENVCETLGINPADGLVIFPAKQLAGMHVPPFLSSKPVLLSGYSQELGEAIELALRAVYPAEIKFRVLNSVSNKESQNGQNQSEEEVFLYLPPLAKEKSFEDFQEIVAHLRAPDGCPWDREQTHQTLRPHLLEEAYETLTAIDSGEAASLREELGDLLLQIVLNAQIAAENGDFTMGDVLEGINCKIVNRHPHVFGELKIEGVSGVLRNWEKIKEAERKANGEQEEKGLLDGVPASFPAVAQAQEIQDRAARVGFDWSEIGPVWEKVNEELEEVRSARTAEELEKELGDLLFAVVNLARWNKVDAESALRGTNNRFRRRFKHIEKRTRQQERDLTSMTLDEMDVFWDEAKENDED
jgi:tetrapyrrole methylase family protein/MazG family protein